MSLKGPLRRLEAGVKWLEGEGTFRHLEILFKMIEMKQEIADNLARNKEKAAEFERSGLLRTLNLPPPSWAARPAPPAPPVARPVRVEPPPVPSVPSAPTVVRDEVVVVHAASPPPPSPSPPEPASRPRPEPSPEPPSEPPLVQPFNYDPPPEMQIRPVTWRRRDAADYADDEDDMYGKCIVDYDPLAQEDADYYDDDDD
jgi:hypothetical protein